MMYKDEQEGLLIGLELAKQRILNKNKKMTKKYLEVCDKRNEWELKNKIRIISIGPERGKLIIKLVQENE